MNNPDPRRRHKHWPHHRHGPFHHQDWPFGRHHRPFEHLNWPFDRREPPQPFGPRFGNRQPGFPPHRSMWDGPDLRPPPWVAHDLIWRRRQRALFRRFALTFGGIILFVVGGMAILAAAFTHLVGGNGQAALLTWIGGCTLSLAFPVVGVVIATRASRDITEPLADVMAAADSVAAGDLTVRVPENSPSEFGKLARTFNHMVDELQRIDDQRRNLTADVAHELRTPLHIIQGNLEGILDGVYQPTDEHIQQLLEETQLLSRLVEDLRLLSLAESGHLPLHKEPVRVAELLEDLATSFKGQAQAVGVKLIVETQQIAQITLSLDVMRMNQVLANLVVNALRYTPNGGCITLRGEPMPAGVRLMVSDTGQGIPADDLPHVFDRFWRGDPARVHKDGIGGGLGLAIVKQLVELHNGQVVVQSTLGKGTIFTISLPTSDASHEA